MAKLSTNNWENFMWNPLINCRHACGSINVQVGQLPDYYQTWGDTQNTPSEGEVSVVLVAQVRVDGSPVIHISEMLPTCTDATKLASQLLARWEEQVAERAAMPPAICQTEDY
jgi:hypothetical protein